MNNTSISTVTPANMTTINALSHNSELLGFLIAVVLTNAAGTLANIILLVAIFTHRPLRKSSSWLLIVHCIAVDLYTTIVAVPAITVPFYLGPAFPLPEAVCTYQTLYANIAYTAGMYATCVLSIHRLVAVVLPKHFRFFTTTSALLGILTVAWTVTVLVNLFTALGMGSRMVHSSASGGCVILPTGKSLVPLTLSTAAGYYFPTSLTGLCYVIIFVKTMVDIYGRKSSRLQRRRLEISRTLFLSFLWHCITVYPAVIILTFFPKAFAASFPLQLAIKWLGNSYSALNPVFFYASSKLFQDGIKAVLSRPCHLHLAPRVRPAGMSVTRREHLTTGQKAAIGTLNSKEQSTPAEGNLEN
ncbi:hypothetical protein BV898_09513 [Hypsibius exemplaris]|uniref:G-protein coupled receptors family 1 profile domain-containing protein n=1 Tax=Hypsibius exemplaris TaxID=2072580 RepID=A0A1W0WME3_HYPEX|nr:hypothetical protein BV898_09513 [Hypsibius exemplaris]